MLLTNPERSTTCADSFCVYDFPFRLRTNIPDAERLFPGLYRNFLAPGFDGPVVEAAIESESDTRFLWRLGERTGTASTLPRALWSLEAVLCETIIRSQRRSLSMHGATIQVGDSVAMLAGCSHSGKTTLSLALVRRGFPVTGDDVALVDPETLNLLPIPRCFHADDRSVALLEADGLRLPAAWSRFRFIVPSDFGVGAKPARRARWLIFMRGPRAEHPGIVPLSQAEMTARLLSESGQGPLTDAETIAAICRMVAGASCFGLTPGPLGETADAVAALLTASRHAVG